MSGFNSFKIINIISIDNFIDIDDILNCYWWNCFVGISLKNYQQNIISVFVGFF